MPFVEAIDNFFKYFFPIVIFIIGRDRGEFFFNIQKDTVFAHTHQSLGVSV